MTNVEQRILAFNTRIQKTFQFAITPFVLLYSLFTVGASGNYGFIARYGSIFLGIISSPLLVAVGIIGLGLGAIAGLVQSLFFPFQLLISKIQDALFSVQAEQINDTLTEITEDFLEEDPIQSEVTRPQIENTNINEIPVISPIKDSHTKEISREKPLDKTPFRYPPSPLFKAPERRNRSVVDMKFTIDFTSEMQEKLRKCFEKNNSDAAIKVECIIGSTRMDHDYMPIVRETMEKNPDYFFLIAFEERSYLREGIEEKKRDICKTFNLPEEKIIIIPYRQILDNSGITHNHRKEFSPGFEEHIAKAVNANKAHRIKIDFPTDPDQTGNPNQNRVL